MKELKISAKVCADTLARPTALGSFFMHCSQLLHAASETGMRFSLWQLFSRKFRAQTAISARISLMASSDFLSTSERMVDQNEYAMNMMKKTMKTLRRSCA